ncbi:hypothetical protein ACFUIY_10180 [Streptomyces griseorubiginosus]|uniref:hypothetical protein n=1 Tax=Streptomyces griseorubiginosus TaxID=67304 RepID=UPI000F4F0A4F
MISKSGTSKSAKNCFDARHPSDLLPLRRLRQHGPAELHADKSYDFDDLRGRLPRRRMGEISGCSWDITPAEVWHHS